MTTTQLPPPSDPARSILSLTDNDFFRLPIEDDHYTKGPKNLTLPRVNDPSKEPTYLERVEFLFRKYRFYLNKILTVESEPEAFFAGTGITFADGEERSLKTIIDFQEELMAGILKAIQHFNDGQVGQAYQVFAKTVSDRWSHFSNFISYTQIPQGTEFFRMREIPEESDDLSPSAMFHVPYFLRHIVGPERFSIAGYPCFYLAESIRVCWEELGRPNFEHSHVVRYVTSNPFQLLDLSVPCWSMAEMKKGKTIKTKVRWQKIIRNPSAYKADYQALIRFGRAYYTHIMLWPLAAACLMHTRYPNARFKAEYILSQLLLQMIRDQGLILPVKAKSYPGVSKDLIDGIIFPSTKTSLFCDPEYLSSYAGLKNLVLVTDRERSNDDYSLPLARVFQVSQPLSIYNFIHYDLVTINQNYQNDTLEGSPLEGHAYYEAERSKRYIKLFEKLHWYLAKKKLQDLSLP